MATVFLNRRELRGGGSLPKVCLICGSRGRSTQVRLSCRDGLFPFSHGVAITTYQEAVLPLCRRHEDYFTRFNKFILLGFGVLAVLLLAAAACFFLFGLAAFAVFFLPFVLGVLILGVTSTIVTLSRTRASAIEDHGVRMTGVSERFVDALEDLRDGIVRNDGEEDERSRRAEGDLDDEEDRPRRRARRGIPRWVWAGCGGALVGVLALGGLTIGLLAFAGGGRLGSISLTPGDRLTRDNLEAIKQEMSDREVVAILGTPTRAEGVFGALQRWDEINAAKTLHWENGSTKIRVFLLGGGVNFTEGTFDDLREATPAGWTEANFAKLKWNMTRAEVHALFGPPQQIYHGGSFAGEPISIYTWRKDGNKIVAWFAAEKLYEATATLNGKQLHLPQRPFPGPEGGGGNPGAEGEPDFGNRPNPNVTEANFNKLKIRMTMKEVLAVLGPPQHKGMHEGVGGCLTWQNGGNSIQVFFKDDRVIMATVSINGNTSALFDMSGPFKQP